MIHPRRSVISQIVKQKYPKSTLIFLNHVNPEDFSDFETAIINVRSQMIHGATNPPNKEKEDEEEQKQRTTNANAADAKKSLNPRGKKYMSFNFINPTSSWVIVFHCWIYL